MSCTTRYELIVVDNNSNDRTKEVVAEFPSLSITYVFEKEQGLSVARNTGVRTAKNEYLIFVDDDVQVCKDWLNVYAAAVQEHGDTSFYGGPVVSDFEGKKPAPEILNIAPKSVKGLDYGPEVRFLERNEDLLAANWACHRESLLENGGFDTRLGLNPNLAQPRVGEESALQIKLRDQGIKSLYLPAASLKHFVPRNKSSIRHIASRMEATSFNIAKSNTTDIKHSGIVPLWLVRMVVASWASWTLSRMTGTETDRKYIDYRKTLGILRGIRQKKMSNNLTAKKQSKSRDHCAAQR